MQNQNSPNRSLNADANMPGVLDLAIREALLDNDDMLPAKIVSWDNKANRAQVEILYMATMTDGSVHQMQAPAEVPTFVLGAGDLILVWPLKPGDLGWIKATDRDISLFLQSYGKYHGDQPRIHCFEDGIFIPDAMKGFIMADKDAACLQTKDGSTAIAIKPGMIKFTVGDMTLTMTSAGIQSNKPINAPQFTNGTVNLIGHVHKENDTKGNTGAAVNP